MKDIKVHVTKTCGSYEVSNPSFAIEFNGSIDIDEMNTEECRYLILCLQNALDQTKNSKPTKQ